MNTTGHCRLGAWPNPCKLTYHLLHCKTIQNEGNTHTSSKSLTGLWRMKCHPSHIQRNKFGFKCLFAIYSSVNLPLRTLQHAYNVTFVVNNKNEISIIYSICEFSNHRILEFFCKVLIGVLKTDPVLCNVTPCPLAHSYHISEHSVSISWEYQYWTQKNS
jgi:hypothetical protein